MNALGINIEFDKDKVCQYLPLIVSGVCAVFYVISIFLNITWIYTALLMLAVGLLGSVSSRFIAQKKAENQLVPITDTVADVFEETEPSEALLQNLETIVVMVNELLSRQIESSRIQSEDAVTAIIDRIVRLNEDVSRFAVDHKLQNDTVLQSMLSQLSDILVSFQFQDRTSQILYHVSNSLSLFVAEVKSVQALRKKQGQPDYDRDTMLGKISQGFTLSEQRAILNTGFQSPVKNNVELF